MLRSLSAIVFLTFLCAGGQAFGQDDDYLTVTIEDPFIELHTGPGRGYPVFYIAERGEVINVMVRRTDWFQVRLGRGQEGWVHLEQLQRTLQIDGEPFDVPGMGLADYADRRWEAGVLYGDFGGANVTTLTGAFGLTENLSIGIAVSEAIGRFADSQILDVHIEHMMYPDRRISPYFRLGGGSIDTSPKATLVATPDRSDSLASAGAGMRAYLTRRFVFRLEYNAYVVFTSRDDNEETREWKAGFSFFF